MIVKVVIEIFLIQPLLSIQFVDLMIYNDFQSNDTRFHLLIILPVFDYQKLRISLLS